MARAGKLALALPISTALALMPFASLQAGGTDVTVFEPFFPQPPVNPGVTVTPVGPTTPGTPVTVTVTPESTATVTQGVRNAYALCSSLSQKEYTVDCLRDRLDALARDIPSTGDYAEAKEVLEDAADQLGGVVQRTRSVTQPPARVQAAVNGTPVTTGPLIPVREEAVADALAEAVAILDEASTKLLRSSTGSQSRMVAYQAMAAAVGSNKVLLRAT